MLLKRPENDVAPVNLLLVEDDDFEAAAVKRAFLKARISNTIIRASDGEEALDILEGRHPEKSISSPLIALVDINMPRMGGMEFIAELRKRPHLSSLICFVLTTSSDPDDVSEAYALNVAGYIVKQTAGEDFSNLLNLLGDYWVTVQMPCSPAPHPVPS
ncbi:response regulator [Tritonibacter horizontis]|uniref:Response regulator rcp1 n=1 Tax=Tritonibacter horizontis TaxID=1768241 RepID=A0A132BWC9_9RHOB|nr:response regulator [Tritonibacter horizontis]KUP92681.1 response regulator rcp1 [Tritonibacter horizontis]